VYSGHKEIGKMMYSGDDFYGDDETSGAFMGCEICGRYECPGECESPDEPDIDDVEPEEVA
jgi:hypothetical protein